MEILNIEQNHDFVDFYLEFGFDFSKVLFICTSNTTENLLKPFLDRIEVINVDAYLPIEKLRIAKKYLIPSLEKEYCFRTKEGEKTHETIEFTDQCLFKIIKGKPNQFSLDYL